MLIWCCLIHEPSSGNYLMGRKFILDKEPSSKPTNTISFVYSFVSELQATEEGILLGAATLIKSLLNDTALDINHWVPFMA